MSGETTKSRTEACPHLMHLTRLNRMPVSFNPRDIRVISQDQRGTGIELSMYPPDVIQLVQESYDDVLDEFQRAMM